MKILSLILTLYVSVFMLGCATTVLTDRLANSVKLYCGAPKDRRVVYRSIVATALYPDKIEVTCNNDKKNENEESE